MRVLNIKEKGKTRGGLIFGGAYNQKYFFCLQVDDPITGGGGLVSGGLIGGSLRYLYVYHYH